MMLSTAHAVEYAFKTFGRSVAETFVDSFTPKYGRTHTDTVEARKALNQLLGIAPIVVMESPTLEERIVAARERRKKAGLKPGRSVD